MTSKEIIEKILNSADIKINGSRPFDVRINDERAYDRILKKGTLGLGESYMDGWWDCEELDEMIFRVLRFSDKSIIYRSLTNLLHFLKSYVFNLQTRSKAREVAEEHYDLGNDLYMSFLDPYNQYSCGYFKDTNDLNKAQEQKLNLICEKLQLKPGEKVLDIGCGWGGFAKYASEHYGCHVTGITLSVEQAEYAKEFTKGLSVEILVQDYRNVSAKYDKIVSVGMFEHVGYRNYRKMLKIVKKNLKQDGLFLLHTIGSNKKRRSGEPWMDKYIFPNGMLPSTEQIADAYDGLFVMEDWHNFGHFYDPTLMAWMRNLDASWPKLESKYNKRFYRMFRYYLLSCAGLFRAREIQLWQVVLSPKGVVGGYAPVR